MSEPFTLLMPVYRGDDAAHFAKAFSSSVTAQTRRPDEVVLVQDGPVGERLDEAIGAAIAGSPVPVVHHRISENVGLAQALSEGLAHCAHDIVARMDADDISLPERFAKQVPLVEAGLDLVGTGMLEFLDDVGSIVGRRVPRTDAGDIARYARFHDPFSHPTVVYRRAAVARAGGYLPLGLMEDYWLFARMIDTGAAVGNLAEPLVMYRVGAGAYARRGGREQWRSELALQRAMRDIRFTSRTEYLRNVIVRGVYRFVPEPVRRVAYRKLIAGSAEPDRP
ncbi:glycosyl transferase [Agromyces sp. Root81]|uniref:glycosyltransferase n=1 Tax=Agromyces sp. Root81 TaxID=1736601 RepID=UPI000701BD90|nr:glycosyltransferase [Agromyces sp. Root81]KRC60484.1 glycosyl transferase [Agromyces sp. Root81]